MAKIPLVEVENYLRKASDAPVVVAVIHGWVCLCGAEHYTRVSRGDSFSGFCICDTCKRIVKLNRIESVW